MRAAALLLAGRCACAWRSEVTLRNVDAPACASRRHDMVLHANAIADAQERSRYLAALPDCSERSWGLVAGVGVTSIVLVGRFWVATSRPIGRT